MVTDTTAPPLTVWLGSAMYTFPSDREVTIGRSCQCDICLDDPAVANWISRVHAVLRVQGAQWVAVDRSRNGIFVDGNKVDTVPIRDGNEITVGNTAGPKLKFRIAAPTQQPAVPAPPASSSAAAQQNRLGAPKPPQAPPRPVPPARAAGSAPPGQSSPASDRPPSAAPHGGSAAPPGQQPRPPQPIGRARPVQAPPSRRPSEQDLVERLSGVVKKMVPPRLAPTPSGSTTIGRDASNAIVVDDTLVSRVHATMQVTPAGLEIRDNRSSNGTFVNGQRITSALLRQGDIVTVGNTDLAVSGTTLVPRPAPPRTGGVQAYGLGLVIDGHALMTDVSFTARPGTLTAVIGPSGAGKSTLIKLVGGATPPSAGVVTFDGHDVHTEYASMRSRIGLVPQDDVVHRLLTVDQALRYAAQLRLPPDTSGADRSRVVERVLAELELTQHKNTRIDKLSGGQRKRASVAMELLTGPSLLILDEPTSGLDPALDRQVMTMLRGLADAGRVVIVVTHSLTYLSMCDQVLLLAPGGKTAFAGPPAQIGSAMGTTDWADIFARVSTDPDGVNREFLARNPAAPPLEKLPPGAAPVGEPPHTSLWRQFFTVGRRQARLIGADRGYFVFLAVLPFLLGALALVVPGSVGLGQADPHRPAPNEPQQILVLLNLAVVFLGAALTIRDLVGERSIFLREQAVGLSASAYLGAKIVVYSFAAAVQTAIVVAIAVAGKGGPVRGAVLLGNGVGELYVTLAATAIVSAMVGLALSSLARSSEQVLPMLVGVIMVSMVFAGGLVPVTGRTGLDQFSWLLPARWGFAASASTVDLRTVAPLVSADKLWTHSASYWLLDMGMLVALGALVTAFVGWRLRLAGTGAGKPAAGAASRLRTGFATGAAILVLVGLAAVAIITKHPSTQATGPNAFPGGVPQTSLPPLPTTQNTVDSDALAGLLLAPDAVNPIVATNNLVSAPLAVPRNDETFSPRECSGAVLPAQSATYDDTAKTAIAAQVLHEPDQPWQHSIVEAVASFPAKRDAQDFQDAQTSAWTDCAGKTVTSDKSDSTNSSSVIGQTNTDHGMPGLSYTNPDRTDWSCQRAMTTSANVVIDVSVCGTSVAAGAAAQIVTKTADNVH